MISTLERLMAAGPPGGISTTVSEPAWREFVESAAETLDVGPGTRLFEVGCGAGAFLYPFYQNAYVVGGLDASAGLISQAETAMPEGRFAVKPSSALDPAEPWDVVVARGFSAFPDLDYARGVLARMAAKASHAVAILDLPDLKLTEADSNLLLFDRQWMLRALAEIGASAVQIEEMRVAGYTARSRFSVFARL